MQQLLLLLKAQHVFLILLQIQVGALQPLKNIVNVLCCWKKQLIVQQQPCGTNLERTQRRLIALNSVYEPKVAAMTHSWRASGAVIVLRNQAVCSLTRVSEHEIYRRRNVVYRRMQ